MYHMKSYKLIIHVNSAISKKKKPIKYGYILEEFFKAFLIGRNILINFATCGSLMNVFWFGICEKVKTHIY